MELKPLGVRKGDGLDEGQEQVRDSIAEVLKRDHLLRCGRSALIGFVSARLNLAKSELSKLLSNVTSKRSNEGARRQASPACDRTGRLQSEEGGGRRGS